MESDLGEMSWVNEATTSGFSDVFLIQEFSFRRFHSLVRRLEDFNDTFITLWQLFHPDMFVREGALGRKASESSTAENVFHCCLVSSSSRLTLTFCIPNKPTTAHDYLHPPILSDALCTSFL